MTLRQLFRNRTFITLFPPCLFSAAAVALYIICVCAKGFYGAVLAEYLICLAACWLPAVIGRISGRPFNPVISWSIGLVSFLGVFLQHAADIYSRLPTYGWLVEIIYGFLAGACMYALFLRWKGGCMSASGTVVFMILATAGMTGIFEIVLYYGDLYGIVYDPQGWRAVIDASIDASYAARLAGNEGAYVFSGHALTGMIDDFILAVTCCGLFCITYLSNLMIGDEKTFERIFRDPSAKDDRMVRLPVPCSDGMPEGRGYVPEGTKFQKFIHSRKFIIWSPSVVMACVGIICYFIRLSWAGWSWVTALQMGGGILACFAVPVLGLILRRHLSPSLTYCISFFLLFSLFLERAVNIYGLFYRYDKVLHTCVGLICAGIIFILLLRWKGHKMTPVGVICTIMLATVGIGVIWEIFEYSTDFTGSDPQRWYDVVYNSVDASYLARLAGDPQAYVIQGNALMDTVDDISVTVIGAGGFCIAYIINLHFSHGAFFEKIFSEDRITRYSRPVIKPDYISAGPAE
ncbi:MAG: hypothetical protein LUE27_07285 [Clostridia bacterium]|nr:hypothetical protein [Clostridia bacterium]MCD8295027.1 hypothetical protein [Clostridia bacterium]